MNILYMHITILLITGFIFLFAEDKPIVITNPDSLNTQIETFRIDVNQNSRINLSSKIGVKFTLIDSIEARFNHIIEKDVKHFWQYIFNLRGGTIHVEYADMDHDKKNVHIQSSSSDILIPKRKASIKINRTGMKLKAEKNNKEVSIEMDHNFDTSVVIDSMKKIDLVVLSDVPVNPALLSERLSEEMKIYLPQIESDSMIELLNDSMVEEHCLRIVILLNRNDNIADTIMKQCRLRINLDSINSHSKLESDLFLGNIEDMVINEASESLLPDQIFQKENEFDSRVIDSVYVGEDRREQNVEKVVEEQIEDGLIHIKGGVFEMGSDGNIGNLDEYPKHKVTLPDFYIDETEITVAEYNKVMGISSAESDRCPECPITNVNFYEAQQFCKKIGKRLPTEAEWEYAVRAGTNTLFYSGNKLGPDDANFDGRRSYGTSGKTDYIQRPVKVKSYKSNYWGLYDMIGNVGEWCGDWYDKDYYSKSINETNPKGPDNGKYKVVRGGTWASPAVGLRSAKRYGYHPNVRMETIGFRCAKDVVDKNGIHDSTKVHKGL